MKKPFVLLLFPLRSTVALPLARTAALARWASHALIDEWGKGT